MNAGPHGVFIAVVGPSGAGKDSLIGRAKAHLAGNPRFHFPQRIITRPPDATEQSASVTLDDFQAAAESGALALSWGAHGLFYGIPAAVLRELEQGNHVIANISRAVIPELPIRFKRSAVVLVNADADVLQQRLAARGRESSDDRNARLKRAIALPMSVSPDVVVENNGSLEAAVEAFINALQRLAADKTVVAHD
jgi:ribose 1,5-bisphosphokinase